MSQNKITVELLVDIAHLGRKGSLIEVSSAQARNMLIPKKMAREVTPDQLKSLAQKEKKAQDLAREKLEKAYEIHALIDGQKLEYTLEGKHGKVFGGINEHDIIERVNQKWNIRFEKNDIKLPNKTHIKTAGTHLVHIHITRETIAKLIIEVHVKE